MSHEGTGVSEGSQQAQLVAFIQGLSSPGARQVPPPTCLVRLAAGVLGRQRADTGLSPEDLVSMLVVRLLEAQERSGETPAELLLADGVHSLAGVLRHRLGQLAAEGRPGRSLRKELAVHVRRALEEGTGKQRASRPELLLVDGRYAYARVRAVVAWALELGEVTADEKALVTFLLREYGLELEWVEAEPEALGHEDARESAEAPALVRVLYQQLGTRGLHLVGAKLRGETLKEMAQAEGRGLTTVFEHLRRSEAELTRCVRASGATVGTARAALRLLAEYEGLASAA